MLMKKVIFVPEGTAEVDMTADDVRKIRNQKLAACDITQLADSPYDKAAWATYRQALRDVPEQTNFPAEVEWPTEPEEI